MTDDQLRRAVRRVLGVLAHRDNGMPKGKYWMLSSLSTADDIESKAVAILREEMARSEAEYHAGVQDLFPFVPHTDDDPTKSFVATTE